MIVRIFFLIIGYSLSVSGGISLIAFLNLLSTGHGFVQYLVFIRTRPELYLFIGGMIIIWISIYFPALSKKDE
jgi:hypothetical protein